MQVLKAIFGTKNQRDIKRMRPLVERINELERQYQALPEEALRGKTGEFRARVQQGESLDGVVVINNTEWNVTTVSTNVVSPGPHAIELRVFNGTGGAGPVAKDGWTSTEWGFGVDRLGRGLKDTACYEPLIDPGDGSFLTTGSVERDPFQDVPVDVAAGATLDLDGAAQCVQLITGGGTVTNGTLAAGSVLSPGGDDATGTLTLSDVTLGAVVYRATLRDAAADVLAFTQPVDLSALVIAPSDALSLAASGRDCGSVSGSRSPATMALMMSIPVLPSISETA